MSADIAWLDPTRVRNGHGSGLQYQPSVDPGDVPETRPGEPSE